MRIISLRVSDRLFHTFCFKVGPMPPFGIFKPGRGTELIFQVIHFLHTKFSYLSDFFAHHYEIMQPMFLLYFIMMSVKNVSIGKIHSFNGVLNPLSMSIVFSGYLKI